MPIQTSDPAFPTRVGSYLRFDYAGESVHAYLPPPLPPDPPLDLSRLYVLMEQTSQALGRLDGIAALLPDLAIFLYTYVRKEAVLSSQIEGTQSSLSDLLTHESSELPGVPLSDVQEVSNYVRAMYHGVERLRGGFPLSLRLLREIHGVLLRDGRGAEKEPGEFRRSQNWIGGTRPGNALYVPPPADRVVECMGQLEIFLHQDRRLPLLVRAGLAHVQFESIHPFLDGNGRLGRLLITLLFLEDGALREPLLYLSLYFKTHRETYYRLLNEVRTHGTWETWLEFFCTAVRDTADQAVSTARRLLAVIDEDRRRIEKLGRQSASALRLHHYAQKQPIFSITHAAKETGLTFPTLSSAVQRLRDLGIMQEYTSRQRNRLFIYPRYFAILSEGTEPLRTHAAG